MGDPIRGVTTPFVESFDQAVPAVSIDPSSQSESQTPAVINPSFSPVHDSVQRLNHFISQADLEQSLEFSRHLTESLSSEQDQDQDQTTADPQKKATEINDHKEQHLNASEALRRILRVENASSKHRTRINTQRIIDTFGRHVTDQDMKPKALSSHALSAREPRPTATPRAGPDVGSSEVQIGILTAKIRVLADRYANENRKDKVNKRNLLVLLHRRQKLLRYMHKKERGSPRWHHMIELLGLTEATWRGQIELR